MKEHLDQDKPNPKKENDPNDEQWKAALYRGDDAAWKRVYEECYHKVRYVLAVSNACPEEDVRDFFQEALMVLHKNPHRITGPIAPWLKQVAVYMWKNVLRKLPKQHELQNYLLREGLIIQQEIRLPEIVDIEKMKNEQLKRCLSQLGEQDQEIIRLFYLEGLDYEEISAHIGITEDTAKQRKHRALVRLKKIMFPLIALILVMANFLGLL